MSLLIDSGKITVSDSVKLDFEMHGNPNGKSVIVINDFLSSKNIWKRYLSALLTVFKLVVYDLRHTGDLSISSHSEDLNQIIKSLHLDKPIIIGSSTATLICKEYVLRYPEECSALVMISPFFSPFGNERKKMLLLSWLKILEHLGLENFHALLSVQLLSGKVILESQRISILAQQSVFFNVNDEVYISRQLKECILCDSSAEDLRKINLPTLFIAGENDFFNSPSCIQLLSKIMNHANVEILDFCGHLPYFESNVLFQKNVMQFLQKNSY